MFFDKEVAGKALNLTKDIENRLSSIEFLLEKQIEMTNQIQTLMIQNNNFNKSQWPPSSDFGYIGYTSIIPLCK